MRRSYVVTIICASFTAALLLAQSDGDYQSWMKTVGATNGRLQESLAAKDSAAVVGHARNLESTFTQVEEFWAKRQVPDAVGFAKEARSAAAAIEKAALEDILDQASADAKTLGKVCASCHMAHREKTETGFRMK